MGNRVAPAPEPPPLPSSTSAALPPLLDLMKTYVQSKLCYHSRALTNARITYVKEGRIAYQIDLWTLMECRQIKKLEQSYNGEATPCEALRNEWDYNFQQPPRVLKKKQKEVHNLDRTRWKTVCSYCNGIGRNVCPSCRGDSGKACYHCNVRDWTDNGLYHKELCSYCQNTRVIRCSTCNTNGTVICTRCKSHKYILHWYQLTIERYTIHSTSYQSNTPLPSNIIQKAPGKQSYWSIDQKWFRADSFDNYFQSAFADQQTDSPVKLNELTEDFNKNHLEKIKENCRIVQLKWDIQKLDVTEVEYETKGFTNKRDANMGNNFRFYYYGKGKKGQPLIYEDDYPLNTCGCFGVRCAHYTKCCTIS